MATYLKALVNIFTPDIDRSAWFYGEVLGLRETYRFPRSGKAEHIEYEVGATTVAFSSPEGLKSHGMPEPTAGHPFELALKTDDVVGAVRDLEAAGIVILRHPAVSAADNKYAYVEDPSGTWISLYENPGK